MTIKPLGDSAIHIQFSDKVSVDTHHDIRRFASLLERTKPYGVIEWVPTYTALTVYYKPDKVSYIELKKELEVLLQSDQATEKDAALTSRLITVPTLYGDEVGQDLVDVASYNGLSVDEVIQLHTSKHYRVYMMGFLPGFCYLGGLPKSLATPRLGSPRAKIAAGSVGIAGEQTGIYPIASPGGWRIIGQTPIKLFNPADQDDSFLVKMGDFLRFKPISKTVFTDIVKQIEDGTYNLEIEVINDGSD